MRRARENCMVKASRRTLSRIFFVENLTCLPVRSVVMGYEFALNYCPDDDKGDHDLATIGPNRHINSQADSIHLLLNFYRVKTTIHDHQ